MNLAIMLNPYFHSGMVKMKVPAKMSELVKVLVS